MPNIKLKSSDEVIFDVEVKIAKASKTIKTMLEDCGMEIDESTIVPLINVSSRILRKVLEWAVYHKEDLEPTKDDEKEKSRIYLGKKEKDKWDADFLAELDHSTLFELITAANYLDIKLLLDMTCQGVANMIAGKTTAEICETFQVVQIPVEDDEVPI